MVTTWSEDSEVLRCQPVGGVRQRGTVGLMKGALETVSPHSTEKIRNCATLRGAVSDSRVPIAWTEVVRTVLIRFRALSE